MKLTTLFLGILFSGALAFAHCGSCGSSKGEAKSCTHSKKSCKKKSCSKSKKADKKKSCEKNCGCSNSKKHKGHGHSH